MSYMMLSHSLLKEEISSFLNFIGSPVKFDEIYLPKKYIELRFDRWLLTPLEWNTCTCSVYALESLTLSFKFYCTNSILQDFIFDNALTCPCFLLVGHTRYSTQGESDTVNVQPFVVETIHGLIAVGHNGELINAKKLKQKVPRYITFYISLSFAYIFFLFVFSKSNTQIEWRFDGY